MIPTRKIDVAAVQKAKNRISVDSVTIAEGSAALDRIDDELTVRDELRAGTMRFDPEDGSLSYQVAAPVSRQHAVGFIVRHLYRSISHLGQVAAAYDIATESPMDRMLAREGLLYAIAQLDALEEDEAVSPQIKGAQARKVLAIGHVDSRLPSKLPLLAEEV